MLVLTIRTDKPEAEVALYKGGELLVGNSWLAHRRLADMIHTKIKDLLENKSLTLTDLGGVVVFSGPGSFTGLRIGISVANALAEGLNIPIVSATGDQWQEEGCRYLELSENEKIVVPEYGAPPKVTQPKK